MNRDQLRKLLERVQRGTLSPAAAERKLRAHPPTADLEFATVDHHRALRQGRPEVVYGPQKTPRQVTAIAREIAGRSGAVLVTRVNAAQARALKRALPKGRHDAEAEAFVVTKGRPRRNTGIALVTAGTSDLRVAAEVRLTSRFLGHEPDCFFDVGVAGLHRLMRHAEALQGARVVVVVAGMEGALASVVGGLVPAPVVGVPTSVGYGAGAGGQAALLAMLNSCAANVCCVNIDDGFGAGVVACAIVDGGEA